MQYIEEITAGIVAVATVIATVLAAVSKIKKGVDSLVVDEPSTNLNQSEKEEIVKDLTEMKLAMERIKSDMNAKIQVHGVQIDHLEKDVAVLFEKTDKLTDILIEHFSK